QAEDGIRDKLVTGVQTCALPILLAGWCAGVMASSNGSSTTTWRLSPQPSQYVSVVQTNNHAILCRMMRLRTTKIPSGGDYNARRSEERRVGKEWRCQWVAEHQKK